MKERPIRVLIVDDSAVVRGFWTRFLDVEPDIEVVASAWNGRVALDVLEKREIDVVVLDVEMPEMSGIEALPRILERYPDVRVLMASSLTQQGAEVTIHALALGAADYVAKPSARGGKGLVSLADELVRKVRALGRRRAAAGEGAAEPVPVPVRTLSAPAVAHGVEVIAIASSTGGPNALSTFLSALPPDFPVPILIVQHMPPLFTAMLADRLGRIAGRPCREATEGVLVRPGHTYVAPGDRHMVLRKGSAGVVIALNEDPPENFCRPSADPFFRSVAATHGGAALAVVLTGMGSDGREGARALVSAGARVVVQDRPTSVVWGMPGAVASAGLAHEILPLDRIAPYVEEQARVVR